MLIARGPGVSTKPIKTAYSSVAGTAFVTFDKVFHSLFNCRINQLTTNTGPGPGRQYAR